MPLRSQLSRKRPAVHPALFLSILAALILIALWSIQHYRHPVVKTEADIVRLLPPGDVTAFYANLDVLRASGYLQLFANNSNADPEYRQFIAETNFDFTRDLDAIAGAWASDHIDLFLKGRLDWRRFREYVAHHNGHCGGAACSVASSQAGRYLSFRELQSNVMIAVIGPDADAAARYVVAPNPGSASVEGDPVWLHPATSLLQNPNGLPFELRILAIALQSAQSVTISLAASKTAAFDLKLQARFEQPTVADTAKNQLVIDTKSLQIELAREHATVDPGNLSALLTSGRFWTQDKVVYGAWPVRKELLNSLR